ncbi:Uncharacterized protein OBRU01_26359, partial [Operophtera brumata]
IDHRDVYRRLANSMESPHFDTSTDERKRLRYPLTYLIVGIAFVYTAHFVMVTDLIMQAHLVPLVCQLTVLADCFVNIIKDCKEGIT